MKDEKLAHKHIARIKSLSQGLPQTTIMEVCGGHTNLIMKYGLREILPDNLRLISGPGCPVCVTPQKDIDAIIQLAHSGIPVATYGDMLRVPGSVSSLDSCRADGGKVFEVYSSTEVLRLSEEHENIVFFGVGFETTAPMTAYLLSRGICVYSVHRVIPPALSVLAGSVDGFIDPGHVSTIIGSKAYRDINVPQAIAGFTPERLLRAIAALVELIRDQKPDLVNAYPEAVSESGNTKAQELLSRHFTKYGAEWRGIGVISSSGLEVSDPGLNAKLVHKRLLKNLPKEKPSDCRCGDVLAGKIEPDECPLFSRSCNPEHPYGACMVSSEGACAIHFLYSSDLPTNL